MGPLLTGPAMGRGPYCGAVLTLFCVAGYNPTNHDWVSLKSLTVQAGLAPYARDSRAVQDPGGTSVCAKGKFRKG